MDYRTRLAYAEQDLLTQSALIRELVEGLETIEWSGLEPDDSSVHCYRTCPVCGNYPEDGHKPDCDLSALIKRGKEAYEKS